MLSKRLSKAKRFTPNSSDSQLLAICLAFFVVIAMNLSLTYYQRPDWYTNPFAYLPQLFNSLSLIPLLEFYAIYELVFFLRLKGAIRYQYVIPSCVFGFFMVEGHYFDSSNAIDFLTNESLFTLAALIAAIGYTILFLLSFSTLDYLFVTACESRFFMQSEESRKGVWAFIHTHTFGVSFFLLTVSLVPLMVTTYPGLFMGDTPSQMAQALMVQSYRTYAPLDESSMLINHHPVIHTLLIRACLRTGLSLFNSYNAGVFMYVIIQCVVMSLCISYVSWALVHRYKISVSAVIAMVLFFILHPRFHQYFVQVTKDSIYSTLLLVFVCGASLLVSGKSSRMGVVVLFAVSILCSLFRKEAFFITVPTIVILSLFKLSRKQFLMILVTLIAVFLIWNRVMLPLMHVVPGSRRSSLSIPFQQTARYLKEYPEDVTQEEQKALDAVFPTGGLAEAYDQNIADPVLHKFNEDATDEDLSNYFIAWASMLRRHPDAYIRAFLGKNYQFFYPSERLSDYYPYAWSASRMEVTNSACGSSFCPNTLLLTVGVKLESIRETITHLPIINFLVSASLYVYLSAFYVFYSLVHKRWHSLALSMVLIMQIAVLIAGPTNGYYFRYSIPIVANMPFLFLSLLSAHSCSESQ